MKTYHYREIKFWILLLGLVSPLILSQELTSYNKIYYTTFIETSQKNMPAALHTADSLYSISSTPLFKTRSLMLSASLYQQTGDLKKAIDYALKAQVIITGTSEFSWMTRVNGFLATQYRLTSLYGPSKKYAKQALEAAQKIEEPVSARSAMGLIYQEMAYNEESQENFEKSIDYCLKSNDLFSGITTDKNTLIADNYYLLGRNYYKLKKVDDAIVYYNKAIALVEHTENAFLLGKLYSSIANAYIESKEFKKAKKYLDKAEKLSVNSNYLELKKLIYNTSQNYYIAIKSMDSVKIASKKKDSVVEKINEKKTALVNQTYYELEDKKAELNDLGHRNNMILSGVVLLCLGFLTYTYSSYRKKQKRNLVKFRLILRQLKSEDNQKHTNIVEEEKIIVESSDEIVKDAVVGSIMPSDTERRILSKLEEFESGDLFLQNVISLSHLASHLETNTKYLSYVINLHKKKDFNNYINGLRIKYIVRKLRDEPIYRKYKIATIAEEAGFSSPNKFALIFKKTMSLTPSAYIKLLEIENVHKECETIESVSL